jgi:hypothetical protein
VGVGVNSGDPSLQAACSCNGAGGWHPAQVRLDLLGQGRHQHLPGSLAGQFLQVIHSLTRQRSVLLRKLSRCGREGHIVAQFMQASDQIAGLLLGADLVEVLRTQVLIVDPAIEYEVGRL